MMCESRELCMRQYDEIDVEYIYNTTCLYMTQYNVGDRLGYAHEVLCAVSGADAQKQLWNEYITLQSITYVRMDRDRYVLITHTA
jgi:hypothetical protein